MARTPDHLTSRGGRPPSQLNPSRRHHVVGHQRHWARARVVTRAPGLQDHLLAGAAGHPGVAQAPEH
eukprot:4014150-Karenia_brevis.AAC.1